MPNRSPFFLLLLAIGKRRIQPFLRPRPAPCRDFFFEHTPTTTRQIEVQFALFDPAPLTPPAPRHLYPSSAGAPCLFCLGKGGGGTSIEGCLLSGQRQKKHPARFVFWSVLRHFSPHTEPTAYFAYDLSRERLVHISFHPLHRGVVDQKPSLAAAFSVSYYISTSNIFGAFTFICHGFCRGRSIFIPRERNKAD